MRPRLRSKKMARPGRIGPNRRNWTSHLKNGPDRPHGKGVLRMDRRDLMAGFGAASLSLMLPSGSPAQGPPPVAIKARRGALNIRSGSPETPVWMLDAPELRFRRGDNL